MNNSILIFLTVAVCALSFILGARFFPKPQREARVISTLIEAPVAITPIPSRSGKSIRDTIWITKIQIDSIMADTSATIELAKPFNLEFFPYDSNYNTIAYMNILVNPMTKAGILDSLAIYPIRVDSVVCPDPEGFNYWNAVLYFGIGYVTHIIVKDKF